MATASAVEPVLFCVAGVPISIRSDDPAFVEEFRLLFGGTGGGAKRDTVELHVDAAEGVFEMSGDDLASPASFLASFSSPDIPIRWHESATEARPVLAVHDEPMFTFEGSRMHFRDVPRWRRMLAHVAFLRLLRLRPDAIFLHAASVSIDGRGVLLIGPKGAGKTTLSSTLAVRGHGFLGDETAMCIPATMTLVPFARPLAIKRGPACAQVASAVAGRWTEADPDGVLRLPIDAIADVSAAQPVPLRTIVFLRGFESRPRLVRIPQPGRDEAAMLQPLGSSLTAGDAPRRVFEMFRMLSTSNVFHLHPGDPDATATIIEEAVSSS